MPRRVTPPAEVHIDSALVQGLLEDQHPDLANLPINAVGSGWDNALFRLGDALSIRLPRRAVAAPLILNEQRWLNELAPRLPLPVPVPHRIGAPGRGYPWSWSVTRWFEGVPASQGPPLDETRVAHTLGAFLSALHTAAPDDAPVNGFRGLPLSARSERLHECVDALDGLIDRDRIMACWERLSVAPPWSGRPVWLHGDLHTANLIVSGGTLAAVIDFGDLTAGDPATDLAIAWMLFPRRTRATFREAVKSATYRVDDAMWTRARGWALALSLAWLVHSANDNDLERETLTTIDAVLAT